MVHISCWFMLMTLIYWEEVYITIKENAETFIVASKEIGLEVNADKSTWSCIKIRMQDTVNTCRLIIIPLKGWKSSNIW